MLEIERKYLVEMPDQSLLLKASGYRKIEILQTYLKAEKGVTRRVRKSTENGNISYVYNEKRRVSEISCIEDEREITEKEYLLLLGEKEEHTESIVKTRRKFTFGEQIFEVDTYPFSEKIAVCETELADESLHADFPDFIKIIREVSGNRAYSNHAISRALYNGTAKLPLDEE